jgi:hypothetical protein
VCTHQNHILGKSKKQGAVYLTLNFRGFLLILNTAQLLQLDIGGSSVTAMTSSIFFKLPFYAVPTSKTKKSANL